MKLFQTIQWPSLPTLAVLTLGVAAFSSTRAFPENGTTRPHDPSAPAPVRLLNESGPIITRDETIETRVGEKTRVRTGARILDVAVTRPEVAEAFITGDREITLLSNSPGVGKAIARLDDKNAVAFKVRVYVADAEKFAQKLREKIGHIQGINIEAVKGRIVVDGRVLYLKDMDAIERAIGDNPSIINLTSLSSRNARIVAREIQRELRASGIYGAGVEVRKGRVTLVGSLGSELLVRKAEHIASTYTPTFDSLLKVATRPENAESN